MRRMTRMTRKAKTKKKMKTNLIMINKMRILLVTPPTNESNTQAPVIVMTARKKRKNLTTDGTGTASGSNPWAVKFLKHPPENLNF